MGDGEEEGAAFSNQPATEIKGRDGRPRLDGEGEETHRGAQCHACAGPSQLKIKTKEKRIILEKKKVQTMPTTTSGSLTRFRGRDGRSQGEAW